MMSHNRLSALLSFRTDAIITVNCHDLDKVTIAFRLYCPFGLREL